MPLPPTPLHPERPQPESAPEAEASAATELAPPADTTRIAGPNEPLSFIPHAPDGSVPDRPVIIRTARYGELEEHELIRLLDTIEDERARGRFRESLYIALFFWLAIMWVIVYGPHYLWHAPKVVSFSEALRQHELTVLNAPVLPHPAPKLPPHPIDRSTMEHLREEAMRRPAPTPPAPAATPQPTPPPVQPAPVNPPATPAPVTPPPTPTRTPPPIVAEAPTPQPSTTARPSFSTPSASESMRNLSNDIARGSAGAGAMVARGTGRGAPVGTGIEVLSPNPDNVNLDPYLRRMLRQIYDAWIPLIPEEVQPPLNKTGSTLIRFRILPDGHIGGMWLDGSSHDDAINKAAWGSITSVGQFEPLPSRYHQPNLELRIDFEILPASER